MYDVWCIRHTTHDFSTCTNRPVFVNCELWKLIVHRLRQFTLFEIEQMIVPEENPSRTLVINFYDVWIFVVSLRVLDLPVNHQGAFFTLSNMSAELIRLAHGQPKRRKVIFRRKQKMIDPPVRLLADKIPRQTKRPMVSAMELPLAPADRRSCW